jgi:hypothetical protein
MTRKTSDLPVDVLRERFLRYQERQQIAIRAENVPVANRHFLKVKQYADALTETSRGRDALEELAKSPFPFVRLRAAHRVRAWAPKLAIPVLGRLVIEKFEPDLSVDERLELRISAMHSLCSFFGISSYDQNELIDPLKAYGVDLPYEDHSKWR